MLRATITKFKRAYALAGVPRVLRGDFQIPPCNFEKISTIVMSNYKSTSTGCDDEDKCKRLIEAVFGPDKPPEDSSTGPIIPDSEIVAFKKGSDKDGKRNYNLAESSIVNATTSEGGDEKLVQKLEKIEEPPLVDAEQRQADELINNSRAVWFSDRDICKASSKLCADINILDELAKRCINAPKDKIDSKLLEEMEKIGILQPCSQECSNVPVLEDEVVQMSCPKMSHNTKKENEIELEICILEKNSVKAPRRYVVNRRAMRRLATNMERRISGIKRRAPLQETPQKFEGQHVIQPVNNEMELLNSTQTVTEEEKQNKNSNAVHEKVQDPFMNIEHNNLREIIKYLYEERIPQDSLKQTSRTSMETPALILSKVYADVDDFRIIPDIAKGEFLTGQTAINSEKKDSADMSSNTTVRYKHAGQSEMDIGLEEIRRVFDEEKVPLHPFVDLTNSGIERTSQKTKSQGLESGLDLLQHEYPLNDDITEKIGCQTIPCTNEDIETPTTKEPPDTTLKAETTNLERKEGLSKPFISSAMIQLSKAATESAYLKEDVESHLEETNLDETHLQESPLQESNLEESLLEAVDTNPQSQLAAEFNHFEGTTEATDPQPIEMMEQIELNPKDSELSLSELLRRVRERSRYETYEQIMFTSQVPEVEPFAGKPPCTPLANPPPKILPPRPCPPKPKKIKKEKKDPCSKFQKSTTLYTLGLIVTRAPKMEMLQDYGFPEKRLHAERIAEAGTVMLVPDGMESLVRDIKNSNFSNRKLSQKVLNFIRKCEPWDSPFLLVTSEQMKK